jgi:hypothetical protein
MEDGIPEPSRARSTPLSYAGGSVCVREFRLEYKVIFNAFIKQSKIKQRRVAY